MVVQVPVKLLPGVLPPSQLLLEQHPELGWDWPQLWGVMGRVGQEGIVHPGDHLRAESQDQI